MSRSLAEQIELVQAFLAGEVPRARMAEEIGADRLREIEQRRDAFEKDLAWGLKRYEALPR
ncbi:MAG TPA: hypothetical protein VN851_16075 [Thermoanaerobaculia bacterium]|nr:hypothetical protein [Thermoanaerobaculia bacterium]